MKTHYIFCILITLLCCNAPTFLQAQNNTEPYLTRSFNDRYHTIQATVVGRDLFPPIIELGNSEQINISFDEFAEEVNYYQYSLIHCNADWRPSALSDLEYLDGFNTNSINDYAYSNATFAHYVHYNLTLPNEDVQFKVSGNYVLQVYPENEPDNIVLQVCFSIYEKQILVAPSVSSRTDIDYNRSHQQVSVVLNTKDYNIQNPYNEVKISILQNGERSNEVMITRPMSALGNQITFAHNRNMIFEAGNEFRRFEMVNNRYAGLGVSNIYYFAPYYQVVLTPSLPRVNSNYIYDRTQFGRFVIRQSGAEDNETEADYYAVHFTLETEEMTGGRVYIDGELTHHLRTPYTEMVYNQTEERYEKTLLLKQGSYNFQYVFMPDGSNRATPGPIEGNFYETVNEYLVKAYYRPIGSRYDRIIGMGMCYSGQ